MKSTFFEIALFQQSNFKLLLLIRKTFFYKIPYIYQLYGTRLTILSLRVTNFCAYYINIFCIIIKRSRSFFVTPRNNDLGPYVPWRHLISAKFLDISAMSVCRSVRPSVRVSVCGKHDRVRTQRATVLNLHIGFYYPYAGWY